MVFNFFLMKMKKKIGSFKKKRASGVKHSKESLGLNAEDYNENASIKD